MSRYRSPRRKNSKKKEVIGGYVYSIESVVATSCSLMLGVFVSFHQSKEERKGRPFSLRPSRSRALILHLSLSLCIVLFVGNRSSVSFFLSIA